MDWKQREQAIYAQHEHYDVVMKSKKMNQLRRDAWKALPEDIKREIDDALEAGGSLAGKFQARPETVGTDVLRDARETTVRF